MTDTSTFSIKGLLSEAPKGSCYLTYEDGWKYHKRAPKEKELNRVTLAKLFDSLGCPRKAWNLASPYWGRKSLPKIISRDGFLRDYARGVPLSLAFVQKMEGCQPEEEGVHIHWNPQAEQFYDVVGAPPGFLSKFSVSVRKRRDKELTRQVGCDLALIAQFDCPQKRKYLTLAVLSHGAVYRELEGMTLQIPSFEEKGKLIPYVATQHLIAEGVKTVSLTPQEEAPGIYLCQGTEMWPSQPAMLGSLIANLGIHGSATDAYRHSWRRIHKHLRELKQGDLLPYVAGHSMGGAMAMQIALYSHDLIELAYASNPPLPNRRDYAFYQKLQEGRQQKLKIVANLDDFAFWRIGAKVIGQVRIHLGKTRWRYYPVHRWEMVLLIPAAIKLWLNVMHAFPAHQHVIALDRCYVSMHLTEEEIALENAERLHRFDYMRFLPKLYDPTRILLRWIRKLFGWPLQEQYIRNEIEIIALHERELLSTRNEENAQEVDFELEELALQKRDLEKQLPKS
ncbi:MAG: hypothetical protein S4CHLAM81_13710 [Chlamydiales bacterium]|nr:hypothetical protein [Chlamydiales bacterium]MCH9636143.1 hypothetical protein [Chlamydiales bacterium]MCH9703254.1 hypothetical protein [Chlamydiota bacterium]